MQTKTSAHIKGIDVSKWQGNIDWKKVASDGVRYAFIKATEGSTGVDRLHKVNAFSAAAAGIKIGYYHYARPENNLAAKEAVHFAETVKGLPIDLPLVLDVEGEAAKLGKKALTAWCLAFLRELEKQTGKPAMLYTGASFAKTYLDKELAAWPLWIAHYGTDKPMANSTWERWAAFQFTDKCLVAGIAGAVDVNAMEPDFFKQYTEEDEDVLKLSENEKTMLVNALNRLVAAGTIGKEWPEKAAKGELTISQLTWLNTIIMARK